MGKIRRNIKKCIALSLVIGTLFVTILMVSPKEIESQISKIIGAAVALAPCIVPDCIVMVDGYFSFESSIPGQLTSHGPNPQTYTPFSFITTFPETVYSFGASFDGYVGIKTPWNVYIPINDKVTLYSSMYRNNNRPDAVWAGNFITHIMTGANVAAAMGMEIDVNNMDVDIPLVATGILDGLNINSGGTKQPWRALAIGNTQVWNKWRKGIDIIDNSFSDVGLQIGSSAAGALINTDIFLRQMTNAWDTILLQRQTDVAPTGNFFRAVNAANGVNLAIIDIAGNIGSAGYMDAAAGFSISAVNVVGTRKVGWFAPVGNISRASFDPATVTTEELAQRIHALIDDLTTHGLIGP